MTTLDSDEEEDALMAILQDAGMRKRRTVSNAKISSTRPASDTGSPESPPTSGTSSPPSSRSIGPYARPTSVRGLAEQTLAIATAVINGDVSGENLDRARLYSNLVRTTAQLITSEVQKARFLRETPNLTFFEDEDDEPDT